MAGGRQGKRTRDINPIERGRLGSGMMSDDARKTMDITKSKPAADQGAEAGSDLEAELEKTDTGAAKRR
jgi:hypothetical protein